MQRAERALSSDSVKVFFDLGSWFFKLLKKFFSEKSNWCFENFDNIEKQNQNSYENPVALGA